MSEIVVMAASAGVSPRTIRRWVEVGLVRGRRTSPRRLELTAGEWRFVQSQLPLLIGLRKAVRTERRVRLAVLFGSVARGESRPASDVDVLVSARDGDGLYPLELQERLSEAVDRDVRVTLLRDVERDPAFLSEVRRDGRVIVDRGREWALMQREAASVERREDPAARDLMERAWGAADALEAIKLSE